MIKLCLFIVIYVKVTVICLLLHNTVMLFYNTVVPPSIYISFFF